MSFSALLCAQFRPVGEWRRSTVDDILVDCDKMYLNAIESSAIQDEQTISLNCFPYTICSPLLSDSSLVSNQLSLGSTNTSELPNRQNQNAQFTHCGNKKYESIAQGKKNYHKGSFLHLS